MFRQTIHTTDDDPKNRTEEEARRLGRPVRIQRFPWKYSGRAATMGAPEGLTKIIIEPQSGRIIGAGMVGRDTKGLISEAILAIEMGPWPKTWP